MSDLIDRQAAIDAAIEAADEWDGGPNTERQKYIEKYIKALPTVQPKSGKWIDAVIPNDNGDLLVQVCDQCNTFFPLAYIGGVHHFCPNCGAKMERGEEEWE